MGTYKNRYYVNEAYYSPGGPVFLLDAGESVTEAMTGLFLYNSTSFYGRLLQEFHGMGVLWEHRYYGDSVPFGTYSTDPDPEQMKYLTTDQALADIPYFAQSFTRDHFREIDLTSHNTPWVMMGRSYPGMRAALARQTYPDTIFAAYVSSAPVEARIDASAYFNQVWRALVAKGFENCARDTQAAMQYIDEQLAGNRTAASIKQKILGPGAEANSNGDIAYVLSTPYLALQESGTDGQLGDLCTYLETDPHTNHTAGPHGLASTLGQQYVAERLASWPGFVASANAIRTTNCSHGPGPSSCDLSQPYTDPMALSWVWQTCTEWGYFLAHNAGPLSLVSKYLTVEYQQDLCSRNFPTARKTGRLPVHPPADAFNARHGGWHMRPANTYWTVGEWDPWRAFSVFSTEAFAPDHAHLSSEVPECGVETGPDEVFGFVLQNQQHGDDIGPVDNEQTRIAHDQFTRALRRWLPCFGHS